MKSVEKPKMSKVRTLLRDTGYQNNDLEIVFSIKEWKAIDREVQKLEEASEKTFTVLANIPCPVWEYEQEIDDAIQEAHDILDIALHVRVVD